MGRGSAPLCQVQQATKSHRKSAVNRRARQDKTPVNSQTDIAMRCPVYRPVYKFTRVLDHGYDIITNGIVASLGAFDFRLDTLPSYTDFTNLFDMYRITKIEVHYNPEYTELTDAALVSNAVNVYFNTAIDLADVSAPTTVDDILQYQQLVSTPITKAHSRSWRPTILMGGSIPCSCWVPTSNPSERHYALKYGIPATGVAMTFRCRIRFHLEFANVN